MKSSSKANKNLIGEGIKILSEGITMSKQIITAGPENTVIAEITRTGHPAHDDDLSFFEEENQAEKESRIMENLKHKEAEGHELTQILGMVAITNEATEAMTLITEKNRKIEEVTAEAETAKKEVDNLKKIHAPKPISRSDAQAKAARMWEASKNLEKVEEVAKQINDFELGREGESAIFEMTNKKGQSFKTSNSYLFEAIMKVLKEEVTKKAQELEQELKDLY